MKRKGLQSCLNHRDSGTVRGRVGATDLQDDLPLPPIPPPSSPPSVPPGATWTHHDESETPEDSG